MNSDMFKYAVKETVNCFVSQLRITIKKNIFVQHETQENEKWNSLKCQNLLMLIVGDVNFCCFKLL